MEPDPDPAESPILTYRSGQDEPAPPTTLAVIAGAIWAAFSLLTVLTALFCIGIGAWMLIHDHNTDGVGAMLPAILLAWVSSFTYRAARRYFSGGQTAGNSERGAPR